MDNIKELVNVIFVLFIFEYLILCYNYLVGGKQAITRRREIMDSERKKAVKRKLFSDDSGREIDPMKIFASVSSSDLEVAEPKLSIKHKIMIKKEFCEQEIRACRCKCVNCSYTCRSKCIIESCTILAEHMCKCVFKDGVWERIQTCEGCDDRFYHFREYYQSCREHLLGQKNEAKVMWHAHKYEHKYEPGYVPGANPDSDSESDFVEDTDFTESEGENDPTVIFVTYCKCILCFPQTGENIQCMAKARAVAAIADETDSESESESVWDTDFDIGVIKEDIYKLNEVIAEDIESKIQKTESEIKSEIVELKVEADSLADISKPKKEPYKSKRWFPKDDEWDHSVYDPCECPCFNCNAPFCRSN